MSINVYHGVCIRNAVYSSPDMDSVFLSHVKEVLEIEDREIGVDDEFRSYEEWSSLAFLSMIAMIDEEYGVIIDGNTFRTLKTWKDVIAAIQARKG